MAFTSPELVRTHLSNIRLGETAIADVPVVLAGTTAVQLPHAGLVSGTVVVKARRSTGPIRESKTLGASWVALSYARSIPGTVIVAKDSSLGTIYYENIDYVVDYAAGKINRTSTGAIANGQTVVVWYDKYHVYTSGDDSTVNTTTGELTRRSTGAIADGQTVQVDYSVSLGAVSDTVIDQAITESGEIILVMIDTSYHESPAPGIVIGATHWAVAAICRMRAAAALADAAISSSTARTAAQTWLELADQYERTGRQHLARFATPVPTLQTGRFTSSGSP